MLFSVAQWSVKSVVVPPSRSLASDWPKMGRNGAEQKLLVARTKVLEALQPGPSCIAIACASQQERYSKLSEKNYNKQFTVYCSP